MQNVLTPQNVREIEKRLQVEAGDRSRRYTRGEIERMADDIDRKWRAQLEGCRPSGC